MPAPIDLRGRSLLAVFAHPDDESIACGGLLAWCAHLGADVSLLCMTRGEQGQGAGDVGRTRSRELEAAARALGIGAVTLLEHADGMLPWLPADTARSDVARAIRACRPEIVITFDADGLYWHPDHIAVHERTTAAVVALGNAAPALYYVTTPPGSMRAVADHAAQAFRRRIESEPAYPACPADPDYAADTGSHQRGPGPGCIRLGGAGADTGGRRGGLRDVQAGRVGLPHFAVPQQRTGVRHGSRCPAVTGRRALPAGRRRRVRPHVPRRPG